MLKNRATGDVLFVVLFTLYLKEDVNEDGSIKEGVEGGKKVKHGGVVEDCEEAEEEHKDTEEKKGTDTSADDVD